MKRIRIRNSVYFLLLLIVLATVLPLITQSYVTGSTHLTRETVSRSFDMGDFEMVDTDIILSLEVDPPELTEPNSPVVKVSTVTVMMPNEVPVDQQFCVDRILIYENVFEAFEVPGQGDIYVQAPVCLDFGQPTGLTVEAEHGISKSIYPENLEPFLANIESRLGEIKNVYFRYTLSAQDRLSGIFIYDPASFWYPYDNFSLDFTIVLHYHLVGESGTTETRVTFPDLRVNDIRSESWDISISYFDNQSLDHQFLTVHPEIEDSPRYSRIIIDFRRSIALRLVYPVIVVSMFFFVLLLSQTKSIDGFVEGSLAVMFGIFSLREILIPPEAQIRTLLDAVILLMYMLFGIIVIVFIGSRIARVPRRKSSSALLPFDPILTKNSTSQALSSTSVANNENSPRISRNAKTGFIVLSTAIIILGLLMRLRGESRSK